MAKSNANKVRNQGVLEEKDFDGDPNEREVATWVKKKLLLTLKPNMRLNSSWGRLLQ